MRIVGPAPVLRHDGQQRLGAPVRIVVRRPLRRRFPDARGQVRKEPAHLGDRVGLVLGEVHDDAVPDLGAFVAQFFLRDPLPGRLLDHLRPADEHLARALDHDAEVTEARLHGRQTGDRAQDGRDHRNCLQKVGRHVGSGAAGQVGPADLLEGLHAAAGRIEKPDEGQPAAQRELLGEAALVADVRVRRPTADREVAAGEGDLAAVDAHGANDHVGGFERRNRTVFPGRRAGQRADLVEGPRIRQQIDALAHRQLSAAVLEGNAVGAAHLLGHAALPFDLFDVVVPAHSLLPFGLAGFSHSVVRIGTSDGVC